MKSPNKKRAHIIKKVALPSHCHIADNVTFGWGRGGELTKEVAFIFVFLLLFWASPFCDVQWLPGFPFCEAVILYSLLFKKLDPFCTLFFFVFCLTCGFEKLKLCPIILMLDWFHAWMSG